MSRDLHETDCDANQKKLENLFAQIFQDHHLKIYRLAFSNTKSEPHASDIVQEVFLKLWEHRLEMEAINNIEAWLHRVSKHKIIDFLRKTASDEHKMDSIWKTIQQSDPHPGHLLEAKEVELILHKAIKDLPAQRQEVFRLNRETGLSYREIAEELSLSKHTVKNQLSLAMRFLQKKFSIE